MFTCTNPQIEAYCISKSSLPPLLCNELEDFTRKHIDMSQMLIGKLEASLLGFLIRSINAKRVLEIGTFTGYSALSMATHLPQDGKLVTLDISEERTNVAKEFWAKSEHGNKIDLILGPAKLSLAALEESFDFIFIDADKENCLAYLKRCLELLSPKGIIAVDNCLWDGKVLKDQDLDEETRGIKELTDFVFHHKNLYSTLLPVRDGVLLIKFFEGMSL